jgi:hypothetical protein
MSPIEMHVTYLLYTYTLNEILELCDVEELDLLSMLIETRQIELPDFIKMEEPSDGDLFLEGTSDEVRD